MFPLVIEHYDFQPEPWHSLAHYINSGLSLQGGLSGLVAGGRKKGSIQLVWQERRVRGGERQEGCCTKGGGVCGSKGQFVRCGAGGGQCWGAIIPITCSTVSRGVMAAG